jgi:hypothetical protein
MSSPSVSVRNTGKFLGPLYPIGLRYQLCVLLILSKIYVVWFFLMFYFINHREDQALGNPHGFTMWENLSINKTHFIGHKVSPHISSSGIGFTRVRYQIGQCMISIDTNLAWAGIRTTIKGSEWCLGLLSFIPDPRGSIFSYF